MKNFAKFLVLAITILYNLETIPPEIIPPDQYNDFTLNGSIPVEYIYRNETYSSDQPIIFRKEDVKKAVLKAKAKQTGHYGKTDTYLYDALEKYLPYVAGKDVAVLGSQTFWYESILLAYKAHPTTIEYNKIVSQHPKIKVMTVEEYDAHPQLFDALVSISSFEHDGLGRYGDPINPNGDFLAMQKAKKMLRNGGILFLSIPVGKDFLVWNLHRIYGHIRLEKMFEGWEVIDSFGFTKEDLDQCERYNIMGAHQPIFVLRPK